MDADEPPGPPIHPLAGPELSRFLDGPAGGLIVRADADGRILAASRRLARRMGLRGPAPLADALTDRSARRWRALVEGLEPGGSPRRATLRFRGRRGSIGHRCLVHRDPDGSFWVLAIPAPAPRAPGSVLARELSALNRHLARSADLTRMVARARIEARTDPLTGLANRRQGSRWLRHAAASRREPGAAPFCCIVADLDDFKAINDTLGHAEGDRVLRAAARRLRGALEPPGRIYRHGGDEFVILLPGADLDDGRAVAERLRASLSSRTIRRWNRSLYASFGVACLKPGESAASLFRRADHALVRAKRAGRDGVQCDP